MVIGIKFLEFKKFWLMLKNENPILRNKAIKFLIPFATCYLGEAEFSVLGVIKSDYPMKINEDSECRAGK